MNPRLPSSVSRRELLKGALLFSASLMLPGWADQSLAQKSTPLLSAGAHHFFCVGDWGVGADQNQTAVAKAMQDYARSLSLKPEALLLLGDNFYGPLSGVDSPRWRVEFEEMYPASAFPGPCYAILGNHDYDDQIGGEKIQLAYSERPNTRWRMPARWYRVSIPEKNPVVTFLFVDTHYAKLTPEEIAAQEKWLHQQLTRIPNSRSKRWLIVCGHHPVLSCGLEHGASPYLSAWRELFAQHHVDAYLCGHEHDLQHLREEGQPTDWVVSGGGGRKLYPVAAKSSTQFAQESFGFFHLALQPEKLTGTFVSSDGLPIYSFAKTKSQVS